MSDPFDFEQGLRDLLGNRPTPESGYVPWDQRATEQTHTIRPLFVGQGARGGLTGPLDILNRPLYAVANLAYGDPDAAARALIPFGGTIEHFTGLPTGLAEEERRGFEDVLKASGVGEMGKVNLPIVGEVTGRSALGLGLDIGLDPMTYLGGPIGEAIGKGAQLAKASRAGQRLAETRPVQALAKAFLPTYGKAKAFLGRIGQREYDRRALEQLGWAVEKEMRGFEPSVLSKAARLWEETRALVPQPLWKNEPEQAVKLFDDALATALEHPDNAGLGAAVEKIRGFEGKLRDLYIAKEMMTVGMERGHVAHLFEPKGEKFWTEGPGAEFLRRKSVLRGSTAGELEPRRFVPGEEFMRRTLQYSSIAEMNGIAMEELGRPIWDADVARVLGREFRDAGRAVSTHDLLTSLARMAQDPANEAWIRPLAWVKDRGGKDVPGAVDDGFRWVRDRWHILRDVQVRDAEASVLADATLRLLNPEQADATAAGVLRVYDTALAVWKRWTLGIFPAYHARNLVSNAFNMVLGGVPIYKLPGLHASAWEMMVNKAGNIALPAGSAIAEDFGKTVISKADFLAEALRRGWVKTGQYTAEMALEEAPDVAGKLLTAMKHPWSSIPQAGGRVAQFVEDGSRLGMALWGAKKGMGLTEIDDLITKHLFDWTAASYTKFENEWLRRIFPFYGWLRKNVPLQVEMLFRKPQVYATLGKVKRFIEADKPTPEHLAALPDWIRDKVALNVGHDTETGETRFWYWGNWLPAADLEEALHPWQLPLENLSPGIKVPLEMLTGYDFRQRRPLEGYPGERDPFMALNLPWWAEHPLRSVRLATTVNRILRYGVRPSQELLGLSQAKVNLAKEAEKQRRQVRIDMGRLKWDLKRARQQDDEREAERLLTLLNDMKAKLRSL